VTDWTGTGTPVTGVGAPGATIWTPTTLGDHIRGVMAKDYDAAGGAVPPRLTDTILAAYRDLWERHEWRFRRRRATLTLVAGTATADLPADFEKFDLKWLRENNKHGSMKFTGDEQAFHDAQANSGSTSGQPSVAVVEPIEDLTDGYSEILRVSPTPSSAFIYPYLYLCYAPTLALDASPLWPQPFHSGWFWLCKARCYYDYRRDEEKAWQGPYKQFLDWLATAKDKNNEWMVSDTPLVRDEHRDIEHLASTNWLSGIG